MKKPHPNEFQGRAFAVWFGVATLFVPGINVATVIIGSGVGYVIGKYCAN